MTSITDDNAGGFVTGRRTAGTSAAQLSQTSRALTRGVEIYADAANTGVVYIGNAATVTADANDDTDGRPIPAGKSRFFVIDDLAKLYHKGSAAGQKFWFYGV